MQQRLTRSDFERRQRKGVEDEFRDLLEDEHGESEHFIALALDTFDELGAGGLGTCFRPRPNSGSDPESDSRIWTTLTPTLRNRWKQWRRKYDALSARNRRLRLADLMNDIAETHSASSWPYGLEEQLWSWAREGNWEAPPFDDRRGIVTEAFFNELRDLSDRLGGWLVYRDGRRAFVPEPEWAGAVQKYYEQASLRRAESDALFQRYEKGQRQRRELLEQARADTAFWQALLKREGQLNEIESVAKRAAQPFGHGAAPSLSLVAKATGIEKSMRSEWAGFLGELVEDLHRPFLGRVRRPDGPSDEVLVLWLRTEARRELGLPGISWSYERQDGMQ